MNSTYIVKFVFQIHTNSNAAQFDEQWRVILGESEAEVIKKPKLLARQSKRLLCKKTEVR